MVLERKASNSAIQIGPLASCGSFSVSLWKLKVSFVNIFQIVQNICIGTNCRKDALGWQCSRWVWKCVEMLPDSEANNTETPEWEKRKSSLTFLLVCFTVISLSLHCEKPNVTPPRLRGMVFLRLKEEPPFLVRCVISFSSLTPSFPTFAPGREWKAVSFLTALDKMSNVTLDEVIAPTQGKSYDFRWPKMLYIFCCFSLPMSSYLSAVILGNWLIKS